MGNISAAQRLCILAASDGASPGWLWKRLRTLLSGVLKKAVAMELYSPSAQKSFDERQGGRDGEGEGESRAARNNM